MTSRTILPVGVGKEDDGTSLAFPPQAELIGLVDDVALLVRLTDAIHQELRKVVMGGLVHNKVPLRVALMARLLAGSDYIIALFVHLGSLHLQGYVVEQEFLVISHATAPNPTTWQRKTIWRRGASGTG